MGKNGKPPGRQRHTAADNRIKKQIGANLIRARKALGLEQEQLADVLGCPKSTLNKYEYGISFPKPMHFERLIELGVSVDFLFTGVGKPITGPVDVTAVLRARKQAI